MRRKSLITFSLLRLSLLAICFSCVDSVNSFLPIKASSSRPVPDSLLFNAAPILTPQQALETFQLPEGFSIELVASEPLIHAPVAMDFDAAGRIWVVEMQSYMPDSEGNGESQPNSRIVILDDLNRDGQMDHAKVFLDSLIMPRAISVVSGGILYAEPPNLWFVENKGDKAGKKVLVDASYASEGNPEHMANGLMRGIDNWYYNAKSAYRYQYRHGRWIKEETEFRGQWGITIDNVGRLFYNTNSNQLRGDLVAPNKLNRNKNFSSSQGINVEIAADQQVFPIRPTTGVNRGYKEEVLDEKKVLRHFTAACGPVIYRGDKFPASYRGNAFVCEPAANLIKRNIIIENGPYLKATQAYADREFLASTDERFRPVNLYNGPDGQLYVVDMYRGIIQHKTYLTDYLREEIKSRKLEQPLEQGRIYRIVYKEKSWTIKLLEKMFKDVPALHKASEKRLIAYLSHPNGWWRDKAQHLLIEKNSPSTVPVLIDLLRSGKYEHYNLIHALWTLEGMGQHTPEVVQLGLRRTRHPQVMVAALQIGERNSQNKDAEKTLHLYEQAIGHKDPRVQLQLALSLGEFMEVDSARVMRLLANIALPQKEDLLMREAIVSSLQGKESTFLTLLKKHTPTNASLVSLLDKVVEQASSKKALTDNKPVNTEAASFLAGKQLYEKACAGCHQSNGEGFVPVAPPLAGSEWVTGPQDRLIQVVLHGLKGPVTVKGKVYKEPEVQPLMPGFKHNGELTDEKLAKLLSYIRQAWSNQAPAIEAATVSSVRSRSEARKEPFTEKELLQ